MEFFPYDGHKLAYTVHGEGPRTTILMPGLLLSQKMQTPLATDLAAHGNRVVTLDFLGHGASDRPEDMRRYSMPEFARQALALLDHLELPQAIVGGTSLGANVTLELAAMAPERLRGMVIEMPVLDNAIIGCAAAFTPLLLALTYGKPAMKVIATGARQVPRGLIPFTAELVLDWIGQDPGPSAAVLQGILFGRTAPDRSVRQTFDGAGARDRPPARPRAPVLRRRPAHRRAPQRPPDRRQLDHRVAGQAGAPHGQDRRVRGRVLGWIRQRTREATLAGSPRLTGPPPGSMSGLSRSTRRWRSG